MYSKDFRALMVRTMAAINGPNPVSIAMEIGALPAHFIDG
jgi:hypothetical protein